jgi:hypothetical protein
MGAWLMISAGSCSHPRDVVFTSDHYLDSSAAEWVAHVVPLDETHMGDSAIAGSVGVLKPPTSMSRRHTFARGWFHLLVVSFKNRLKVAAGGCGERGLTADPSLMVMGISTSERNPDRSRESLPHEPAWWNHASRYAASSFPRASSGSDKELVSPEAFFAPCCSSCSSLASVDGRAVSPSVELAESSRASRTACSRSSSWIARYSA